MGGCAYGAWVDPEASDGDPNTHPQVPALAEQKRRTCYRMHCSAKPCARGDACEAIRPKPLSPAERLDEIARLLALGFLRLRARRSERKASDPNHFREFGLDFA